MKNLPIPGAGTGGTILANTLREAGQRARLAV